jgi:uncharacterized protein
MNIRRLTLDVDKSIARPSVVELARALESSPGVEAVDVTVTEIDLETVGMDVTVEGQAIDYEALLKAIEKVGAVVNSIDQIVAGNRLIERAPRQR